MGRIDDVLNVAGHRLGTMEIESALVAHPKVAESAVVGKPHDIKGESVFAYVVLRGERPTGASVEAFTKILRDWVSEQLGAIARPDDIRFVENLPKTRSGKILRRLLRAIARNEDITQDLSTLENPAIIDQLRGIEKPKAAARKKPAKKKPAKKKTSKMKSAPKKKVAAGKRAVSRKAAPRKLRTAVRRKK
jgi:acetyl-CoA synthetase